MAISTNLLSSGINIFLPAPARQEPQPPVVPAARGRPSLTLCGRSLICHPAHYLSSMITLLFQLLPFLFGGHRQHSLENLALRL
jgi:hypothetical protein